LAEKAEIKFFKIFRSQVNQGRGLGEREREREREREYVPHMHNSANSFTLRST